MTCLITLLAPGVGCLGAARLARGRVLALLEPLEILRGEVLEHCVSDAGIKMPKIC